LDAGEGQEIPTLDQVLDLFRGNIFMNIELKAPLSAECQARYDCHKTAEAVYSILTKHSMHGKFLISSFGSEILKAVEDVRAKYAHHHPRFEVIYLYNHSN